MGTGWFAIGGIALAGALLAAGCARKPVAASAGTPAPAPAAASAPPTLAGLPVPRAGLWETTVTGESGSHTDRHCGGGKPFSAEDFSRAAAACSRFDIKRGLTGGVTVDAICGRNGFTGATHADITGNFNSTYVSDVTTRVALRGRPPMVLHSHSVARYLGPCPAGMTPQG